MGIMLIHIDKPSNQGTEDHGLQIKLDHILRLYLQKQMQGGVPRWGLTGWLALPIHSEHGLHHDNHCLWKTFFLELARVPERSPQGPLVCR